MCSGTIQGDRNSHDAGLAPVKGKRLVIAEELKANLVLDTGFLKRVSGGDMTWIGGRGFKTDGQFAYIWQAGIILVFNQNDCPQFDAKDTAFTSRMAVIPMRSKFVPVGEGSSLGSEPHTFPMDMGIKARFPTWRSSMLDVMMERYTAGPRPLPASMRAWHDSVTAANNPLSEWMADKVEATGNESDVVLMSDLKAMYKGHAVKPKQFTGYAGAYFERLPGVTFKAALTRLPGRALPVRNVVFGVRLVAPVSQFD